MRIKGNETCKCFGIEINTQLVTHATAAPDYGYQESGQNGGAQGAMGGMWTRDLLALVWGCGEGPALHPSLGGTGIQDGCPAGATNALLPMNPSNNLPSLSVTGDTSSLWPPRVQFNIRRNILTPGAVETLVLGTPILQGLQVLHLEIVILPAHSHWCYPGQSYFSFGEPDLLPL